MLGICILMVKIMYKVEDLTSAEFKRYSRSNLPIKYIKNSIDDFKILGDTDREREFNEKSFNQFMEYYNNLEDNLREGRGIILCGSVGIAKTFLLTQLAKKVMEIFDDENKKIQDENLKQSAIYNKFYYIQATTLTQLMFPTGLNEDELKVRRGIKTIAGLWIDDISKLSETKGGHEISFLDDILRWRDLNNLTTFYTSQLPFDSFKDFKGLDAALSKPIHDMIRGNTEIITLRGESQR